jgi:hypothetical protein
MSTQPTGLKTDIQAYSKATYDLTLVVTEKSKKLKNLSTKSIWIMTSLQLNMNAPDGPMAATAAVEAMAVAAADIVAVAEEIADKDAHDTKSFHFLNLYLHSRGYGFLSLFS